MTVLPRTPHRIGVATDHGGCGLKHHLVRMLPEAGYDVIDFGDRHLTPDDDYPDLVVPLARAIARGEMDRGVAICGSGATHCCQQGAERGGVSDPWHVFGASRS